MPRESPPNLTQQWVFMPLVVPVVFLILPVTVFFAFWPGLVGLSLTSP